MKWLAVLGIGLLVVIYFRAKNERKDREEADDAKEDTNE